MVPNMLSMVKQQDEKTGKFVKDHSDDEFLTALREIGPAGTSDVAEKVGAKYDATYARLRELESQGLITGNKVANARLWDVDDE